MNTWSRGIAGAAAAVLVALPASAQHRAWGFGVHGSWLRPGELAEAPLTTETQLHLDEGFSGGAGLEHWFGSRRVGLRLQGSYAERPFIFRVDDGAAPDTDATIGAAGDVINWYGDGAFLIRLLTPEVDRRFAPFLSLGAGAVHWNLPRPGIEFTSMAARFDEETETRLAAVGGLGTDIFLGDGFALRIEGRDYYHFDSPMVPTTGRDDFGGGHNLMLNVGLNLMWGGAAVREPGFVQRPEPAPTPTPAPQPRPAPEPEPRFETVSMCVVGDDGRLRTVSAIRDLDTRDLFVQRGDTRVRFQTLHPANEPAYVRSAGWYVNDRPLVLDLDAAPGAENRIELVRFGTTSTLSMNDLVYVGEVDGTPLWVRSSEAAPIRSDLEMRLRTTMDLEEILEADRELAEAFSSVETYYVAVEPGCIFQPVSSTMIVRRTRG